MAARFNAVALSLIGFEVALWRMSPFWLIAPPEELMLIIPAPFRTGPSRLMAVEPARVMPAPADRAPNAAIAFVSGIVMAPFGAIAET